MSAEAWIARLAMRPHPEGGYYAETYRAPHLVRPVQGGHEAMLASGQGEKSRAASSAIYFLLIGSQISALHRIRSDELWHFYSGSALTVSAIDPEGELTHYQLGTDFEAGERFQHCVPAGCWFGARLRQPAPDAYALVGCTVAPAFDFADFELAERHALLGLYPQHAALIGSLTPESR